MSERKIEKFTPSQEQGINKLTEFLNKPITNDINSRVFVLKGKAGTGKTTMIRYALKDYLEDDASYAEAGSVFAKTNNVLGVTLSHKAKEVLRGSIPDVTTFAAYFGMKQIYHEDGSIEFKPDQFSLEKARCNEPIPIIVHDEVSMYDISMINLIIEKTNKNSKIILMGDAGQLPPINTEGDKDSPAFTLFMNQHELVERVRQTEGNPIVDLSDIIYEEIFGNQDLNRVLTRIEAEPVLVDGLGYDKLSYQDFLQFYKECSKDYRDAKVTAYRNTQVDMFNNSIRNFIYQNPDQMYIKGELIYMNETFRTPIPGTDVPMFTFYNSQEYMVEITSEKEIMGIKAYSLFINKDTYPNKRDLQRTEQPHMFAVSEKGKTDYNTQVFLKRKYALEAKGTHAKLKWKNYYEFINKFAQISYAYCFTMHKIQGSTYRRIFIDYYDILTIPHLSNKRKLQALYTSLTRASHNATFLTRNIG